MNTEHPDTSTKIHLPIEPGALLSRRAFVRTAALASAVLSALRAGASAQEPPAGATSYATLATGQVPAPEGHSPADQALAAKIRRALLAGPPEITEDATVADMDEHGDMVLLRQGTNHWMCFPGNENTIGDPPMCADPLAMQWFADAHARKPKPTNTAPGLCYMLCGATQHSNTDPHDNTSPAIPIGPHWMILWPFEAKTCGLPTTVRDAGAWVMFDGTPYAYLHICGSPWVGNEYHPGDTAVWKMHYAKA